MTTDSTPPLGEFINLEKRRQVSRQQHGFRALDKPSTVAVYKTKSDYQILTIRISDKEAERLRLVEGMRLTCHIHPDGKYLALRAAAGQKTGSGLFRPKGSRSLVYQTTLKADMLTTQKATAAELTEQDGAFIVKLSD